MTAGSADAEGRRPKTSKGGNRDEGTLPGSMLHFGAKRLPVKVLPVTLPMKSQPIEIVTLKNRTLSPVAKTFIECLHTIAKPLTKGGP